MGGPLKQLAGSSPLLVLLLVLLPSLEANGFFLLLPTLHRHNSNAFSLGRYTVKPSGVWAVPQLSVGDGLRQRGIPRPAEAGPDTRSTHTAAEGPERQETAAATTGAPKAATAAETKTAMPAAELEATRTAAAAAAEIEGAFVDLLTAAARALSVGAKSSRTNHNNSNRSSSSETLSVWPEASSPAGVRAARASFLTKVAGAFGLRSGDQATGVVYVHRSSNNHGRLLVNRQLLLRLRGLHEQKGDWLLHFLGTGAMQASVRAAAAVAANIGAVAAVQSF